METAHPWIRARKQGLAVRSQPISIPEYKGIPYGACFPRMSRHRDGQIQNPQGSIKLPPLGARQGYKAASPCNNFFDSSMRLCPVAAE